MSYLDEKVKNLVDHLKSFKEKSPEDCERLIKDMVNFHIENNDVEAEFWRKFLEAWKAEMD